MDFLTILIKNQRLAFIGTKNTEIIKKIIVKEHKVKNYLTNLISLEFYKALAAISVTLFYRRENQKSPEGLWPGVNHLAHTFMAALRF